MLLMTLLLLVPLMTLVALPALSALEDGGTEGNELDFDDVVEDDDEEPDVESHAPDVCLRVSPLSPTVVANDSELAYKLFSLMRLQQLRTTGNA